MSRGSWAAGLPPEQVSGTREPGGAPQCHRRDERCGRLIRENHPPYKRPFTGQGRCSTYPETGWVQGMGAKKTSWSKSSSLGSIDYTHGGMAG